jgi:hypothetical protein
MKGLAGVMLACALGAVVLPCEARTRTLAVTQELPPPGAQYLELGFQVAIDGDSIIALADREGGRSALLYRRGGNGQWYLSGVLLDVAAPPASLRAKLAMKNGIAVLQLDATLHVYERSGAGWVEAQVSPDARQPGGDLAISGSRIAVGLSACLDDTLLLEKSTGGIWSPAGRVTGPPLACTNHPVTFDLNDNTLLVRRNEREVHVYAKYLQEFDWPHVEDFQLPADSASTAGPLGLQKTVAVAPGSMTYRRVGGIWNEAGRVLPVDYANGAGHARQVVFRDGVAITRDGWSEEHAELQPYVYVDNGAGFDHAAILDTFGYTDDVDVSGRTVVTGSGESGYRYVTVFTLPSPLLAPRAQAFDFENRDVSGWTQTAGGPFALATNGSNDVYRQSGLSAEAHAILTDSDWSGYQSIEVDITPTQVNGADRWVGAAVRYVDENNFYYVTLRSSNRLQLKRKVNGVFSTLREVALPVPLNERTRLRLAVDDDWLTVDVNGVQRLYAEDQSLSHGRVALMSYRIRADFDNVYVGSTKPLNLAWKNYREVWYDWGRNFDYTGGNWELTGDADPDGISQTTTAASANALIGAATDEQSVSSRLRLDSFNASPQGAWFGLFARYVDASTHYYVSWRSSHYLQIRKQVNGQITVLASVALEAEPGRFYDLRFDVFRDQLHVYVDGVLLAQAIDGEIPRGRYGLGTYRTAATFQSFEVNQP